MPVEIELKAWLSDHKQVKKQLFLLGRYARSFEKTDTYWFPIQEDAPGVSIPYSGLRVRRESSVDDSEVERKSVLVTVKKKKMSGNIEVNDEREFTVSDADLFEELVGNLGLFKAAYKKKSGWEWKVPSGAEGRQPVSVEISMVKDLGWFLELELLADGDSERVVEESRREFACLLAKLNIPEEKIEVRSYTKLLQERWDPR
ncbi:MAG: CYTH domain-containing protein [Treponema sp.]|nr:CYTH domain-containing protein [Treponema sp.]